MPGNTCFRNIMGLGSSEKRLGEGTGTKFKGDSFIYSPLGRVQEITEKPPGLTLAGTFMPQMLESPPDPRVRPRPDRASFPGCHCAPGAASSLPGAGPSLQRHPQPRDGPSPVKWAVRTSG